VADEEEGASIGAWESKHFDAVTSVLEGPNAFDNMVSGAMYANCVLLYVVFAIVIGGYSLRCLFDDRKNRDILFWRSMPVSETTNVLVKLATIMVVAPVITLLLNLVVTLAAIILGLVFFGFFGVGPGVILDSIFHGQALYLPFIVFYELLFSFVVLSPVFGFALFASAFAKKSPFFLFASPVALVVVDLLMQKSWGLSIGVVGLFKLYFAEFAHMRSAFVLKEALVFDASMVLPLVICVGASVFFVSAVIWLRNNRYEI
jgi:ABC-2 type transport system permease protein